MPPVASQHAAEVTPERVRVLGPHCAKPRSLTEGVVKGFILVGAPSDETSSVK